jgi:hypothetical protein
MLTAVSCSASTFCAAIGTYSTAAGEEGLHLVGTSDVENGLIDTLKSGNWTARVGPVPTGADRAHNAQVVTISCPAASACVAAGTYSDSAGDLQGFVATQSEQGWSAVESPVGVAQGSMADAQASACIHSRVCTAVGTFDQPISGVSGVWSQPLLEALSGTRWSTMPGLVPSNATVRAQERLMATSCTRAASGPCAAVGEYVDSAGDGEGVLIALPQ